MTLEDGDQVDSYKKDQQHFKNRQLEIAWKDVRSSDLEKFSSGIFHLDEQSWTGYLPAFLCYAVEHADNSHNSMVTESLLGCLRPGATHFKVFTQLPKKQRETITAVLEFLALEPRSAHQQAALQVIQECEDAGG